MNTIIQLGRSWVENPKQNGCVLRTFLLCRPFVELVCGLQDRMTLGLAGTDFGNHVRLIRSTVPGLRAPVI